MLKSGRKLSKIDAINNGSSSSSLAGSGGNESGVLDDSRQSHLSNNCVFHFYVSNFFKIPKDIKNDIIYCQRSLKAHIKIHQMVLDVFQQQPDADPVQKKLILDELESEIYEINAEQQFLILRVRRIIDEFYKSLNERDIPIDQNFTNNMVAKEIVPHVNDNRMEITPVNVVLRNTEEKLIEKYFEVQKEFKEPEIIELDDECVEILDEADAMTKIVSSAETTISNTANSEVLMLSGPNNGNDNNNTNAATVSVANVLAQNQSTAVQMQKSLLKPMDQRMSLDGLINNGTTSCNSNSGEASVDMPFKISGPYSLHNSAIHNKNETTIDKNVSTIHSSIDKDALVPDEVNVPTSVKLSRMNLRQALKRAHAAARGPNSILPSSTAGNLLTAKNSNTPPTLAPIQSLVTTEKKKKYDSVQQHTQPSQQHQQQQAFNIKSQSTMATSTSTVTTIASTSTVTTIASTSMAGTALMKKPSIVKGKNSRQVPVIAAAITTPAITTGSASDPSGSNITTNSSVGVVKTPEPTSSSGESSPERELGETRTDASEYGQEMFLRLFDLYTPQAYAQLQQRRSKRRRRCVQKNERSMYHYGKIEPNLPLANSELDQKKKRKTFLLSPQTKKQLPNKRTTKRTSVDKNNRNANGGNGSITTGGNLSRSNSTSPVDKTNKNCNECLQSVGNLEQCVECQSWYHIKCHKTRIIDDVARQSSKEIHQMINVINCKGICPTCKTRAVDDFRKVSLKNRNLLNTIKNLKLLTDKERDRHEILERTSKSYKTQMNSLFCVVNSIKCHPNCVNQATNDDDVITLD